MYEDGLYGDEGTTCGDCADCGGGSCASVGETETGELRDKTLVCKECGQEFVFSVGEQEFYKEKGFQNEPQRCKACRDALKRSRSRGRFSGDEYDQDGNRKEREMYEVPCANEGCENIARVPFKPRDNGTVLCSECYAEKYPERSQSRR